MDAALLNNPAAAPAALHHSDVLSEENGETELHESDVISSKIGTAV